MTKSSWTVKLQNSLYARHAEANWFPILPAHLDNLFSSCYADYKVVEPFLRFCRSLVKVVLLTKRAMAAAMSRRRVAPRIVSLGADISLHRERRVGYGGSRLATSSPMATITCYDTIGPTDPKSCYTSVKRALIPMHLRLPASYAISPWLRGLAVIIHCITIYWSPLQRGSYLRELHSHTVI